MDLANGALEPGMEVEVRGGWGGNRVSWEEPDGWVAQGRDWSSRPVTCSGPADAAHSARSGEQVGACQTPPLVEAVVDYKHNLTPPGSGARVESDMWRTVEAALLNQPSTSHAQGSLATATRGETEGHPPQQEPRATGGKLNSGEWRALPAVPSTGQRKQENPHAKAVSTLTSGEWRVMGRSEQMDPAYLGADGPGNRGSLEERGKNTIGRWEEHRRSLEEPAGWPPPPCARLRRGGTFPSSAPGVGVGAGRRGSHTARVRARKSLPFSSRQSLTTSTSSCPRELALGRNATCRQGGGTSQPRDP